MTAAGKGEGLGLIHENMKQFLGPSGAMGNVVPMASSIFRYCFDMHFIYPKRKITIM